MFRSPSNGRPDGTEVGYSCGVLGPCDTCISAMAALKVIHIVHDSDKGSLVKSAQHLICSIIITVELSTSILRWQPVWLIRCHLTTIKLRRVT